MRDSLIRKQQEAIERAEAYRATGADPVDDLANLLGGIGDDETYLQVVSEYPDEHPELTVAALGWTRAEAAAVRGIWGLGVEDWDDPAMDVHNSL